MRRQRISGQRFGAPGGGFQGGGAVEPGDPRVAPQPAIGQSSATVPPRLKPLAAIATSQAAPPTIPPQVAGGIGVMIIGSTNIVGGTIAPFWSWTAGDPLKSEWDNFLASMPTDAGTGRPAPPDNSYTLTTSAGEVIALSGGYEVPQMNASNQFIFENYADQFDVHNMALMEDSSSAMEWRYIYPNRKYRFDFSLQLSTDNLTEAQWRAVPWCLTWQLHPNSWGPDWSGASFSPPLALYTLDDSGGRFWFGIRGSTEELPVAFTRDDYFDCGDLVFDTWVDWSVEVRCDYTGTSAVTNVFRDGVAQVTDTGSNGINQGGNSEFGQTVPTWGTYSYTTGPKILYRNMSIAEV